MLQILRITLIFLALQVECPASNLQVGFYDMYGNQTTNNFRLTLLNQPVQYGNYLAMNPPQYFYMTNWPTTVSGLVAGHYVMAVEGVSKLLVLDVPDDTNTYFYTDLIESNTAYYAKLSSVFAYWPTNLNLWAGLNPSDFDSAGTGDSAASAATNGLWKVSTNIFATQAQLGNTLTNGGPGNGSGLTALNPANLSTGTAGINITGNAATASLSTSAVDALNLGNVPASDFLNPTWGTNNVIYVDPNGNDTNEGTNPLLPVQTFYQAYQNVPAGGGTIVFSWGSTIESGNAISSWNKNVTVAMNGGVLWFSNTTSGAEITLGGGAMTLLNGTLNLASPNNTDQYIDPGGVSSLVYADDVTFEGVSTLGSTAWTNNDVFLTITDFQAGFWHFVNCRFYSAFDTFNVGFEGTVVFDNCVWNNVTQGQVGQLARGFLNKRTSGGATFNNCTMVCINTAGGTALCIGGGGTNTINGGSYYAQGGSTAWTFESGLAGQGGGRGTNYINYYGNYTMASGSGCTNIVSPQTLPTGAVYATNNVWPPYVPTYTGTLTNWILVNSNGVMGLLCTNIGAGNYTWAPLP